MSRTVYSLAILLLAWSAAAASAAPPEGAVPAAVLAALGAGETADGCYPPLSNAGFRYRGARTCQSAACHGSLEPKVGAKILRNEYTLWRDKDPHSKAYFSISLDNKLSLQILTNLGIAKDKKIVDKVGFQSCEKCHNLSVPVEKPDGAEVLHEGVSCEACHGPSEKWYSEHFKVGFNQKEAIAKGGMTDTSNVFTRARLCAQCHVGGADREVNHDLIAAGHPQLRFELAAYMHLYPKHWNDAVERKTPANSQFELRLWAAGQIAAADATLAQLEARASRAATNSKGAVWPEFAETDCFACHHDLNYPSWRQERGYGARKPGNLPWGSWYFGLIDRLAEKDADTPGAKPFREKVADLKRTMESSISPNPTTTAAQAKAARQALFIWGKPDGALVAATANPARMRDMFAAFSTKPAEQDVAGEATVETWETATQLYLAVSAVNEAYRDEGKKLGKVATADDKAIADRIKQLRADLAYTAGYDSPREFGGLTERAGTKTSPREKVRGDLIQVFQQLERRGEK